MNAERSKKMSRFNDWVDAQFDKIVIVICLVAFLGVVTLLRKELSSYYKTYYSAKAQQNEVVCSVNLDCKTCTYRIKTKQDGSKVCMLVKCRGCKEKPAIPTFTLYPTNTPAFMDTQTPTLTPTDFEEYPEPTPYP